MKGDIAMNHFSYEVLGKEKVKSLQEEGVRSQAVHGSGALKRNIPGRFPKRILAILGIRGLLKLLVH